MAGERHLFVRTRPSPGSDKRREHLQLSEPVKWSGRSSQWNATPQQQWDECSQERCRGGSFESILQHERFKPARAVYIRKRVSDPAGCASTVVQESGFLAFQEF